MRRVDSASYKEAAEYSVANFSSVDAHGSHLNLSELSPNPLKPRKTRQPILSNPASRGLPL